MNSSVPSSTPPVMLQMYSFEGIFKFDVITINYKKGNWTFQC